MSDSRNGSNRGCWPPKPPKLRPYGEREARCFTRGLARENQYKMSDPQWTRKKTSKEEIDRINRAQKKVARRVAREDIAEQVADLPQRRDDATPARFGGGPMPYTAKAGGTRDGDGR